MTFTEFLHKYDMLGGNRTQIATMAVAYETYLLREAIVQEGENLRRFQENTLREILPSEEDKPHEPDMEVP